MARLWRGQGRGGFGLWHGLDAVIVPWPLGLHHVRADAAMPLIWDRTMLLALGLLPLLVARVVRLTAEAKQGRARRKRRAAA